MNAYDHCLEIERRGIEMLKPFLDRESDGRWQLLKGNPQAERLQKECGDVFLTLPSGRAPFVEIKAEETYTGNLVYEDWSNARFLNDPVGHLRDGSTPGWSLTCRSEVLANAFLDQRIAVFCKTVDLLRFANDRRTYKFLSPPLPQRKHTQRNLTVIRLVLLKEFRKYFPVHSYRVDQGLLFPEDLLAIHQLVDEGQVAWHRP
jgi:hypothetical protein